MSNKHEDNQLDFFNNESETVAQTEDINGPDKSADLKEEEKMIESASGEKFTKEEWARPVFDGGPTRQEVEEWKEKYGNVYFIPLSDRYYIFRGLTRAEYREAVNNQSLSMLDREELFTDKCVLFPRNYQTAKDKGGNAGIPSALTEVIMDKSGFVAQSAPIKL